MAELELHAVSVTRSGQPVLDRIELEVADGERVVVLGSSGSGKTSLLRTIAGVTRVTSGRIVIGGRDVTRAPPAERDVALVDQQASLQPHLDVRGNVAFPLAMRGVASAEIDERVEIEARALRIRDLLPRRPRSLSAGQRNEVALARSLVRRASVLMLDEPFANHDAPRRAALLREVIEIQEGYGVTMLCATNDQRVAMGLAQRCVVLDAGRIVQIGPPQQLYAEPVNIFVAGFVGSPAMNLVPGRVERAASGVWVVSDMLRVRSFAPAVHDLVGVVSTIGIRPSDLHRARPDDVVVIEEPVRGHAFLGPQVAVRLGASSGGPELVATLDHPGPRIGELVRLGVAPADVHLFDASGAARAHGV